MNTLNKPIKGISEETAGKLCASFEKARISMKGLSESMQKTIQTIVEVEEKHLHTSLIRVQNKYQSANFLTRWYYKMIFHKRRKLLTDFEEYLQKNKEIIYKKP